ncbi:MAG: magnesium transporter CorA [Betaproteobacteria bacterium]|nr:magnesium transporter CorA [Betaproteobacteria bacterium]
MLNAYIIADRTLRKIPVNQASDLVPAIRWLDLNNPTEQERQWVKQAFQQELQFMEELGEIEASARFYRDDHGLHLNLYFLLGADGVSRIASVAFTVNQGRIYTLHAEEIPELRAFYSHASSRPELNDDPFSILLGIVWVRVGLLADNYERLQTDLESLSSAIFRGEKRRMPRVLEGLARVEDTNGKARLGLLENQRAFSQLLRDSAAQMHAEEINEILRDVESLMTHSTFLYERTKFLMDSALGVVNIEHSKRLNVFTVLSVVLMPPTLIASVYGMNFRHIPELDWLWGYPLALLAMLAAAVGPILYLKRREWL